MSNTAPLLTVTQFHQMLQDALENQIGEVQLEAEVSQCSQAASGHIYLVLKDARSQISAVIWRSVAQRLNFSVEAGLMVVCVGEPNVYHASGRLQLILRKIEPAGAGALQKKFLELKQKLDQEGLFEESRKRPLPFLPKGIGLVTSHTGAAVHDMMVRFKERMPQIPIYIFDSRVQGQGAAKEIAKGIETFNKRSDIVDLIIVGRGGGSLEDLWAFNEEIVCRAIFASRLPVISAVGHEVDISLSDLVADKRAPTPTAAAEIAVPMRSELLAMLARAEKSMVKVKDHIATLGQLVDDREQRFIALFKTYLANLRARTERAEVVLRQPALKRLIQNKGERLNNHRLRLLSATSRSVNNYRQSLNHFEIRLNSVNPSSILNRGYVMVESEGRILNSFEQVSKSDALVLLTNKSRIKTSVLGIEPQSTEKENKNE